MKFQTIDEILREMEEADYTAFLIDGLIDSAVTTIQGDSYLGKTYLALDVARSMTTGDAFLGRAVNKLADRVAFLVTDPGAKYELAKRVKAMGMDRQRIVVMSFYAPGDWEAWKNMLGKIKNEGTNVAVIVDNTTDLANDANSPREVKLITDGLRMWTEDGVAVINIHHMNKGSVYGKSSFGSIIWRKWARAELTLTGKPAGAYRKLEVVSNSAPATEWELAYDPSSSPAFTVISAGEAMKRERQRDKERLDHNAEIARWIVGNCQGIASVSEVARKVAGKFTGKIEAHRRQINRNAYPVTHDEQGRWALAA